MADAWDQFKDADPYAQFADAPAASVKAPAKAVPPAKPQGFMDKVGGFMANVNRGSGIGDEIVAGANTLGDVITGKVNRTGAVQALNAALNMNPEVARVAAEKSGLSKSFNDNMARERGVEDSFAASHPMTAAVGRGVGNAALMAVPAGPGAEAFAGGNLMTNAARGATVAGLTGAGYAAADRGTVPERLMTTARAAHDPVTLGLGAVGGALATVRPRKASAAVPTLEQLTAGKNAAYDAVDAAGVQVPAEDFRALTQDMATAMDKEGFNAGLHPKAAAMMERIGQSDRGAGGASPTLTQLDQLRQQIGRDVASSPDAGERRMGAIMRSQIDDYIAQLPEAGDLLNARDLNTRVEKLRSLDNLDDMAGRRAARTGSGGNKENTLRQNVDRFMTTTPNLTPDEQAAARGVVEGSMTGNTLRSIGKLSPFGNGLGLAVHAVGGVTSHGATLPIAAGGAVAKMASEAITTRNVSALRALIASGGQAAQEVSRQLADPAYAELRAQLANDLAVQAGVQETARRSAVSASVEGHPEYGVGASSR